MPCQGFSSLFNRNLLKSFKVPRKSHLNYRNGNEWGTADTNRTVQNSMGTFFPISLKSERILLYAVGVEKTNKHHCPQGIEKEMRGKTTTTCYHWGGLQNACRFQNQCLRRKEHEESKFPQKLRKHCCPKAELPSEQWEDVLEPPL